MYPTILWATDGSEQADHALDEALRLLDTNGHLVVFHCDQRFVGGRAGGLPVLPDEDDRRKHVAEKVAEVRAKGIDAELFVETTSRDPSAEIAETAGRVHADAIVCGTRGKHGVTGLLTGSASARVLKHASVPVVVVPG
jgi:nucleotide-binding universal stress UspA family protein